MEKIGRGPCYGASVGDKTPAPGALLPQGTARDVPDAKGRTGATRKNCYCFCSPAGASVAAEAALAASSFTTWGARRSAQAWK